MGYTGQRPSAIPLTTADIVDGTISNADLAGSITSAKITSLDATKLTGTVADARFPATLPATSGVNLTALNGSNIGSGTVPTARLGTGTASSSTFLRGDSIYAAAGGGKVLQCLSTVKTSQFTSASTTLVDITGMSQAITPSASSSKVLVTVCGMAGSNYAGQGVEFSLLRGSTEIFLGDAASTRSRRSAMCQAANTYVATSFSIVFLDSPSTTSATTYKLQLAIQDTGTAYFGSDGNDGDSTGRCRFPASITCMEIGA